MRFSILLILCVSFINNSVSQDIMSIDKVIIDQLLLGHFHTEWIDIKPVNNHGTTAIAITSENSELSIEYNIEGEDVWNPFTKNEHQNYQEGAISYGWLSNLIFFTEDRIRFRTLQKAEIELSIIKTQSKQKKSLSSTSLKCKCDTIEIKTRDQWCPDGDCPEDNTPVANEAKFLIIHHSAGGFDAEDYDAVVRSYYRFHVDTRGWDDIGYNYLVSPDGVIYEGRGDGLLGAHFCGTNTSTEGIAMIGDYTDIFPTEASIRALNQLLAYRSCENGIKADSSSHHNSSNLTLRHISGHKDGCNTACPGNILYDFLPFTTDLVEDIVNDNCQVTAPELSIHENDMAAELNWSDPYDYEEQYILEYSFDNNIFYTLEVLAPDSKSYIYDLSLGAHIYFRVRATLDGVDGPCSNVVELIISSAEEVAIYDSNEEIAVFTLLGTELFISREQRLAQDISTYQSGIYIIRYKSNRSKLFFKH